MKAFHLNPLTQKSWRRFRQLRRGWYSFLLLAALYVLTGAAELISNTRPLVMRFEGEWFFPAFRFYPESRFAGNDLNTRADYIDLENRGVLSEAWILYPLIKNDPYRIVRLSEIEPFLRDVVRLVPQARVAGITIARDLTITQATGMESFGADKAADIAGEPLGKFWQLPTDFEEQLAPRWAGVAAETLQLRLRPAAGSPFPEVQLNAAATSARARGRTSLRLRLLEVQEGAAGAVNAVEWSFEPAAEAPRRQRQRYHALPEELRGQIAAAREALHRGEPSSAEVSLDGRSYTLTVEREAARFPFRPVEGHWLGLDAAGRDVFARIFYALRIALNFGLILVLCSMAAGSFFGVMQGYIGGGVDITGQRLIEIWSALPFLYIMILMGSIYGPGFGLLLFCYALFNWIGISQYMRAETLRLRKKPFVEAAKCLGLSGWRIAWKHILPNALVPIITFFPFSLVGAIGALAALDYLGFGLPTPTPSIGELLAQAQSQRTAWWLVLWPSAALFAVMLLGVFVGEGIRNAFDPRRQQRLQ